MPTEARVCGVCGRVLSYWEGRGWMHAFCDLRDEDHPAVPVQPEDIEFIGRCDFCQADHPTFVVPCRPFELEILPQHGSTADWAACEVCARLVDAGHWAKLRRRAIRAFERVAGEPVQPEVEHAIKLLYAQLRENIEGSSRPLPKPPAR